MTSTEQLPAAALGATVGNNEQVIIRKTIAEHRDRAGDATLARAIIASLRANGYVIKRAVPPCVAHSQVDPDAA